MNCESILGNPNKFRFTDFFLSPSSPIALKIISGQFCSWAWSFSLVDKWYLDSRQTSTILQFSFRPRPRRHSWGRKSRFLSCIRRLKKYTLYKWFKWKTICKANSSLHDLKKACRIEVADRNRDLWNLFGKILSKCTDFFTRSVVFFLIKCHAHLRRPK